MLQKQKQKAQSIKEKTRQKLTNILLILVLLVWFFWDTNVKNSLIYRPLLNILPLKNTKALIINEKQYSRGSHMTGMYNYYYEFIIENEKYSNPSYDKKYLVGQTVIVEYSETFPFMNRVKE